MIDIISYVFCYQLLDEKIITLPKMIDVFRDSFNRRMLYHFKHSCKYQQLKNLLNNTVIHFVVFQQQRRNHVLFQMYLFLIFPFNLI